MNRNFIEGVISLKFFRIVKKILCDACVYNTVAVLLLYSVGILLPNGSGLIPKLQYLYMILLFSVLLSIANRLLLSEKLNAFLRTVIHFICVAAVFYVIFIVWGGFSKSGSTTILILLAYTVIYFIFTAVYYIFRAVRRKNKADVSDDSYESQFSLNNK